MGVFESLDRSTAAASRIIVATCFTGVGSVIGKVPWVENSMLGCILLIGITLGLNSSIPVTVNEARIF